MYPIITFDISNNMYFFNMAAGERCYGFVVCCKQVEIKILENFKANIKIDNLLFIILDELCNASVFYTGVYRGPTDAWNASHHQSKCSTNPDRLLGTGR